MTKLNKIRNEINILYAQEIEKKVVFTKQKYCESGSKSVKLIARKLQKQWADNTIYKIKDPDSKTIHYQQDEVQRMFKKYYTFLYTQEYRVLWSIAVEQQIGEFLNSLNLPVVSEEQNKILAAAVTETEVNCAISRLKANKSPGPDGFPSERYKAFENAFLVERGSHLCHSQRGKGQTRMWFI